MKIEEMIDEQGNGDYKFLFGKHEGRLLSTVCKIDYDYVDWIICKSDMPDIFVEIVSDVLEAVENGEL